MTQTEKPKESASTPRSVTEQVNGILSKLKSDVEREADPEVKKEIVRKEVASMNQEQLADLAARVDTRAGEIPAELLDAHVNILDLVSEQTEHLKRQIEAGQAGAQHAESADAAPAAAKPEGLLAQAGDTLKSGAATFTGWMKKFGSWISGGAGKGWKHVVEGATATIAAVGAAFTWMREKAAHLFGSLAASVDDYLPDSVKTGLNWLMGDFGIAYKNFSKFKIEVLPNAPNQELSLQPFMEKFQAIAVTGQNVSFDEYCRLVALELRKDPAKKSVIPLRVTQLQLEQAADQVVQQKLNASPPAPAVVPGAVPAAVPGAVPAAAVAGAATPGAVAAAPQGAPASVSGVPEGPPAQTFDAIPIGTNLLGVPLRLSFEGRTYAMQASRDGTIKIDDVTYKLKIGKYVGLLGMGTTVWVSPSIEKLEWSNGGIACTGTFIISQSQMLARGLLEDFLRKHARGERGFENEKISLKQV